MKNSIKKFVVACAAVTAISAISATAMAADLATDYTADGNSVAVTMPAVDAAKEATVLVLNKGVKLTDTITDADIIYVNQATGGNFDGADGAAETLKLMGESLEDGTYVVAVGYYPADGGDFAIAEGKFTLGDAPTPDGTLGDVDANGEIEGADAMLVKQHAAEILVLDAAAQSVADVDANGEIEGADAMLIQQVAAEMLDKFPAAK